MGLFCRVICKIILINQTLFIFLLLFYLFILFFYRMKKEENGQVNHWIILQLVNYIKLLQSTKIYSLHFFLIFFHAEKKE